MLPVLYAYAVLWAVLRRDPGAPHVIRRCGVTQADGRA
jgi:hypothetical protein